MNALTAGSAAAMQRVQAILEAKNADYAGTRDPFACFDAARLIGLHPLQGILLRMLDKVSRASNLLDSDPHVAGESLCDAFDDLLGYAAIARAWLDARSEAER